MNIKKIEFGRTTYKPMLRSGPKVHSALNEDRNLRGSFSNLTTKEAFVISYFKNFQHKISDNISKHKE